MSQWYYSKEGQASGPIEFDQLKVLLQTGELGHLDQVFEVGSSEWQIVSSRDDLAAFLKKDEPEPTPAATLSDGGEVQEWVVLKQTPGQSEDGYTQLGPFTKSEVFGNIEIGQINFADFGWREGMESWVPLNEIEEFKDPLPSSPDRDPALYSDSLNQDSQDDEDFSELTSIADLVEIQQFQREKTQVLSAEKLKEFWGGQEKKKKAALDSLDKESVKKPVVEELSPETLSSPSQKVTLKDQGITANPEKELVKRPVEIAPEKEEGSDSWTLSPPEEAQPSIQRAEMEPAPESFYRDNPEVSEEEREHTQTIAARDEENEAKKLKSEKKRKKEKKRAKKVEDVQEEELSSVAYSGKKWTESPLPWVASGVAFVVAATFVVVSFLGDGKVEDVAESEEFQEAMETMTQESQEELKAQAAESFESENSVNIQSPPEVARSKVKQPEKRDRKLRRKTATADKPSAKKERKRRKKEKIKKTVKKKELKKKTQPKKREVSSLKKIRKIGTGKVARGNYRSKAFFIQRDRKALFYGAIVSEELVIDLEENFKALRSDKKGWKRFYSGWRAKVKKALPSHLKAYPAKNEQYGYPQYLSKYLKDHELLKPYGELYNSKVMGLKPPPSLGKDLKKAFVQHQTRAQGLGSP